MNKKLKIGILAASLAAMLSLGWLLGRVTGGNVKDGGLETLDISVTPGMSRWFSADELDGKLHGDLSYSGVTAVTIRMNGKSYPLENAISGGWITEYDLLSAAEKDADKGVCQKDWVSHNGLARAVFSYPEFDLVSTRDVYELPNGEQIPIEQLEFTTAGNGVELVQANIILFDKRSGYGYRLDREDWGLDFVPLQTSENGMILQYQQTGGQQLGRLLAESYAILDSDGQFVMTKDRNTNTSLGNIECKAESSGEIVLNWEESYGTLSPGKYSIVLTVRDDYAQIPVLTRKYHDVQNYVIEFEVTP